ncbi:MAG TPA: cbb3-type cytochrome oxidase assembly protein CcoS [Chondromyces sp.]|nr:cbb3-type cytochrome oxidase assembly protein CcoS [Chondromyces sp.]
MSAVFIALPIALLLALAGVIAFIWSVRSGQMDDLETPAVRLLGEDDERRKPREVRPDEPDASPDPSAHSPNR